MPLRQCHGPHCLHLLDLTPDHLQDMDLPTLGLLFHPHHMVLPTVPTVLRVQFHLPLAAPVEAVEVVGNNSSFMSSS